MDNSLKIVIHDADKIVYEGTVDSITTFNERGVFDILPYHTQFISIIKTSITIKKKGQEKKEIAIDSGIIEVENNEVNVFLGIDVVKV